ncbi:MAG: alpha-mannosidase [Candidatus Sumerlaeaceae bacterium]|jgi:alpha-mannosidase
MKKWHCHVISNTHWDREWRYPFQAYRMDLVEMMDRLLDLLEQRAEYRAFYLDSQAVIVEDYLEIRPENTERVKRLVQSDRLQMGPWYSLPDMWACPGEALVRNLLRGHRVARELGRVQKIGYTPFSNGQISQLPQLYMGFGIDHCLFYRGVGKHVAKSEFLWRGADGTQIFALRFGDYARYNYYYLLYRPGLLGRTVRDREYHWNPAEIPFHVANEQSQDRQYGYGALTLRVHEDMLETALDDALRHTAADATTSQLLYMMGHDHSFAAEEELDLLEALAKRCVTRDEEIFHSTFAQYLTEFRKEASELQVLEGEMRHTLKEGLWTNLMALILSCRTYLKQQNARICAKVLYGSEPLAAMARITGSTYPTPFFDQVWKRLLVNQAHDAVGGCSVDRVHVEMQARWGEVETISDEICRRSMRDVALRVDGSAIAPTDLQLTLFNPLPYRRNLISEFIIDIPSDQENVMFAVERADGSPVPMQIVRRENYTATIESGYELTMTFPVQRFYTRLELDNVPAFGYEVLTVRRDKKPHAASSPDIVRDERTLENDALRVELHDDGTFTLVDKRLGRRFENLGVLEDSAEFGDPWNRVVPPGDKPIYSNVRRRAQMRIVERGPLYGEIEVSYEFPVPKGKSPAGTRTREKAKLPISLRVALERKADFARVELRLRNLAENHRLRILFPSGLGRAEFSTADGQFDVLRRPIKLPDATGWKEPPYPTQPMWHWVEVNDGTQGLAVINDGLIEYEVIDDAARTIAITLLRAFGTFVFGRPTPGAQCLGDHVYRFLLYPHRDGWSESRVFEHVATLVAPLQALLSAPTHGPLPRQASFVRLDGDQLIMSGIKLAENGEGMVLRFWNATERQQIARLYFGLPLVRAERLSLEELLEETLELQDGGRRLDLAVGPKKIVTLRLVWPRD